MLGQRNKDIPIDRVMEMQNQGMQNNEIISNLRNEGYNHEQISNAMDQAMVKEELSNNSYPQRNPVRNSPDIPMALMNAPSPSQSNENYNNQDSNYDYVGSDLSIPEPSDYAPEPLERASYDEIEEIAESIIREKWDDMLRGMGDIRLWKERIDVDLEGVKQEVIRTQEKFENLQKAVMGKIKDYSEGISTISSEMQALEKVLEKILSPLTRSVKDLQEVTERVKSTRTHSIRRTSTPKRRVARKRKTVRRKKK